MSFNRLSFQPSSGKMGQSALTHSDLHFIEGKYTTDMPIILGHEAAGTVEAVGEQVSYVKPGDHVITCLSVFCGHATSA